MHPTLAIPIRSEEGPFASLGEQLKAVYRSEMSGRVDERLLQVRASAAGGSEMVPSDGGFLVAPQFSREIVKRMYLTGEIYQRCLEVPMGPSGSFKFPQFDEKSRAAGSRLGGIEAYWENEGAALVPSALGTNYTQKPTFNLSELTPDKVTGYLYVTDELAMDSDAFNTWASYALAQELMYKFEGAIIAGTGAGQPLGILNSPAVITAAAQPGQGAGTINTQNVTAMLSQFWAPSYNSAGSIFLYNQALLSQLATLATLVGVAGSESKIFEWCSSNEDYDRLGGFPCMPSEHCKYPGTPGDLILCDLSRYILAVREKFRAEISIHVRFLTMENTFRFVMRATGQPIDRAPVAAANGGPSGYSTSPFIILAQR